MFLYLKTHIINDHFNFHEGSTVNTKVLTIVILLFLIIEISSLGINSESDKKFEDGSNNILQNNDIIQDVHSIDDTQIDNIQDLLDSAPQVFTENQGQLDNHEVRFYDQIA